MKMRRLGNSGLEVSEVSLGSWLTLGASVDLGGTAKLVELGFDLGINFFDTADVYANGQAEIALGRALQNLPRHHVVVGSKCFFAMSNAPNDHGLSRKHICESVEGSLRRLGTDYLDLHQCHRPDPDTPMDETVRAYEDLIRQGKLLYWGVSEWSAEQISLACEVADRRNAYRPISNQPQYSIMRRQLESSVMPRCRELGVGQVVFSPLGQGALTGKYTGGSRPDGTRASDDRYNQFMTAYLAPEALAKVDQLRPVADESDCSMAQLALAWCLREENVASVIVGATSPAQLQDNCAASGLALAREALDHIDAIFPAPR